MNSYVAMILTVDFLFDWCIGMKHTQRVYKFLKLYKSILLFIEQIKNLTKTFISKKSKKP